MSFTVQDAPNVEGVMQNLNTYHRKYHRQIWTEIYCELKAEGFMKSYMNVKDEFVITTAKIGDVIKRFKCDFEPGPDFEFKPQILKVRRQKADIEFCCMDELWNSYLADMYDLGIDNHTPVMFIRWIFQTIIQAKIIEEIEFASVAGLYQDISDPALSNYTNVVDGAATLAERFANNGQANIVPTGQVAGSGNSMNIIEDFLGRIPKKIRKRGKEGVLWTSEQVHLDFFKDRRSSTGDKMDYATVKAGGMKDDYTGIQIEDFEGMSGSDLIFWTPKWNVRKLMNTTDVVKGGGWLLDRKDRCMHAMKDWHRGYGFIFPQYVWVNDQPLHGVTNI